MVNSSAHAALSTRVYCTTRFNLVHVFTVQQNSLIEEDTPSINGVQTSRTKMSAES